MGYADGSADRIRKEDRHTVRKKGAQRQSGHIGDKPVRVRIIPGAGQPLPGIFFGHRPHIDRMGLVRKYKMVLRDTENLGDAPEVLPHRLFLIPPGKAQIHGAEDPLAHPAAPGGNHMAHHGQRLQGRDRIVGKDIPAGQCICL